MKWSIDFRKTEVYNKSIVKEVRYMSKKKSKKKKPQETLRKLAIAFALLNIIDKILDIILKLLE